MYDKRIIGSCSRCGGHVWADPADPGTCSSCKGRAAKARSQIIEVVPPEDTRQLLTES